MKKNIAASKSKDIEAKRNDHLVRLDGWNNFFTGVGVQGVDRRMNTSYAANAMLPENILRSLYGGDGMAKQVIEIPVESMMKAGFTIMGDPDGMILARMEETKIIKSLENMNRWSRLFGGSLGVIGVDDGRKYEFPLNMNGIRKVHYVHVYNRWRVTFTSSDLYSDTSHPKFGQPQFYRVQPLQGRPFRVHESRTIRMDGAPVDDLTQMLTQGWGHSYLQSCFEEIRQLAGVYTSVESIIDDFVTQTLGIKGLADLMKAGKEQVAIRRLEFLDRSRHTINTNLIDADLETFTKVASSLAGIPDALDRYMNKLSSVTRIPVTLFQGMAPAGLNATGDADRDNWNDQVLSWQNKDLKEPIEYLTRLMYLSQDDFYEGKEPDNWWLEFNKLTQPSEKQQIEMDKARVDTLAVLIDRGVITEDEARDVPEIREKYNLVGPAPEKLDPMALMEGELDDEGNPIEPPPGAPKPKPKQPAGKKEKEEEEKPKSKNKDSMPDDPALARAEMMGGCRAQVMDATGRRRRADSAKFAEKTLILTKDSFENANAAALWVRGHGFKNDRMESTQNTFRFVQGDAEGFVRGTERAITVAEGVDTVLARVKGG